MLFLPPVVETWLRCTQISFPCLPRSLFEGKFVNRSEVFFFKPYFDLGHIKTKKNWLLKLPHPYKCVVFKDTLFLTFNGQSGPVNRLMTIRRWSDGMKNKKAWGSKAPSNTSSLTFSYCGMLTVCELMPYLWWVCLFGDNEYEYITNWVTYN